MKKILVVHYSQSGQLTRIIESILEPIAAGHQFELVHGMIRPETPYPFPWSLISFADAFPESVQQIPCRLAPFEFDTDAHYDAVILAYQVWYLSPSIPINAFLQSPAAANVMRNTPVITIIGCRNMWLLAHEKVKERIVGHGGIPVANITLMDRAANLVGVVTIADWMLTGRKRRLLNIFPKPGVADEEIAAARRFGQVLQPAIVEERWEGVQQQLNDMGAVTVVPSYILFEQRIARIFAVWAKVIRRKGGPGAPSRRPRLRLFIAYLLTAIALIAPLATAVTFVLQRLNKKKLNQWTDYFLSNRYPPADMG